MSSGVSNHRHTSAMEKIIKNAVSESSKVLEKMIVELRAEILQVKSENENLKIRCSQFEAVVKKGTVYRETGTSPEPYIIDKCDKAVQCEITLHHPEDNNPNISDNESERSSVPAYEKESSNDSFEFIQINDDEQSPCDLLDETIKETSYNQETNTEDDRQEPENMENKEMSSGPSKEEIVTTILSSESELIGENDCKTYEMETQETVIEDADNECAGTDTSLLKCQEEAQKELKKVSIDQQEDIHYPAENDVVICKISDPIVSIDRPEEMNVPTEKDAICKESQLVECESSPLPDLSKEKDVQIDTQSELTSSELKSGSASSDDAKSTGPEDHVDEVVSTNFSSYQDKPITPSTEDTSMDTRTAQEQSCTKIDTPAIQPMSFDGLQGGKNIQETSFNHETNTNDDRPEHENMESEEMSSYKEIVTTSLSSEMASMDTQEQGCTKIDTSAIQPVSLKGLPGKKKQKKQKTMNYPYYLRRQRCTSVTQEDAMLLLDSVNLPEYKTSRRTKSLSFETPKMSKTPRMMKGSKEHPSPLKGNASTAEKLQPQQTEDVPEESCINNMVMEDQPKDKEVQEPSLTKPPTVVEIIDLTMDENEPSHDMETSHLRSSVTNDTTPNFTPRKETSPSVRCVTANIDTEDQEMTTTSTKPFESVTQQLRKTAESISVAAVLSALASSLAQKAKVKKVLSSTTDQGEKTQATANTQKDTFCLIPHVTMSPLQPQSNSGETEGNAQIDCHSTHDVVMVTSPIPMSPPQPQAGSRETGGNAQIDCHSTHDVVMVTSPIPVSPPQPQAGSRETGGNAQIDCPVTRDNECQSKPFSVPSTTTPVLNPVIQGNLPVPKPGDTGHGRNLITSRQSLSAAQLSAVVSAVRSSDGTGLPSSGKKTIVVVPLPPVKKPNHKIIVVPRQGNLLDHPPQTIVEDVNTGELVQQQSSAVGNTLEPPHTFPSPGNAQCRNTVQVKLNRLLLPILPTQTISVANKSPSGSPAKEKHDSSGSASKISETATTQPEAQPVKDNLTRPVTDTPSVICDERKTCSQVSPMERVDSSDKPIQIVQLYPSVAADHSYPQMTMTKSQFLAQLHVSPVIQDGSGEKGVQKFSLVDRLRSHIKTHTKSTKKVQVASTPPVDCLSNTNKTAGQNQEQQTAHLQGISPETLPDTVAPVESNTSDDPKIQQVKRKSVSKTDEMVTKTAKKRKLRKCVMTRENTILQSNLRNKLINSNALLSCVRKGLSKNSFLCKFCQKEFPKKSEIEKHIQVHAGKKPFQCNLCRKRFCRTSELSKHLKKHEVEKKYQCTFCGKEFMQYNNLRRHLYIHTGEKPFGCPYCPRTFIQPGYLSLHVNKDHREEVTS